MANPPAGLRADSADHHGLRQQERSDRLVTASLRRPEATETRGNRQALALAADSLLRAADQSHQNSCPDRDHQSQPRNPCGAVDLLNRAKDLNRCRCGHDGNVQRAAGIGGTIAKDGGRGSACLPQPPGTRPITFAGAPATTEKAGTSLTTTLPAPTTQRSPMVTPLVTVTFAPSQQLGPIRVGPLPVNP